MTATFVTADPHFSHAGVCKFLRDDGTKLRPWDEVSAMNAELVERWNDTVRPNDKVYLLGDVAFKPQHLSICGLLNGDKVLIKGNHDTLPLNHYKRYFRDVRAYWFLAGYILSHIPIHPESLARWRGNIHGHLHYRSLDDPRYLCVSVEQTDYRPITLEEAVERFQERT